MLKVGEESCFSFGGLQIFSRSSKTLKFLISMKCNGHVFLNQWVNSSKQVYIDKTDLTVSKLIGNRSRHQTVVIFSLLHVLGNIAWISLPSEEAV